MAEGAGLEPARPFRDDGLAIRSITSLATFQNLASPIGFEPMASAFVARRSSI